MKRVLQRCAELSLALMMCAKASIVVFVPLLLLSELFLGRSSIHAIENVFAGFLLFAIIIYLTFCWFLSDDSEMRERIRAEREARDATLIEAIQQPGYWSKELQVPELDREALFVTLKAQGYNPPHVMTTAHFLAKRIVKNELRSHGVSSYHVEPAVVSAAARAMFPSRAEELIAEAKIWLDRQ